MMCRPISISVATYVLRERVVVTRLLNAGVSPNVSGSDGLTPLHQA